MTRSEFVQRLVLREISDDFENVDQIILPNVGAIGSKCGLTIERSEIVDALSDLVARGLAKGYRLSPRPDDPSAGELPGMPDLSAVEEDFRTYFYITEAGMAVHRANDDGWPLDDDGNLEPGWRLSN
jgi:hypothetical protein